MRSGISERLVTVRERIQHAAERAGRDPDSIELVAVSKFHPAEAVAEAIEAGLRHFAENRFQDTPAKIEAIRTRFPELRDEIRWSFIGTLQSNKVKPVLQWFDSIQSVDRSSLLERINRIAGEQGNIADLLLQTNISGAETQGGIPLNELPALVEHGATLEHVRIEGLMAIGPNTDDETVIREAYINLRKAAEEIRDREYPNVSMDTLSMGMTGDLEISIEEGSTLVRIGTAIFGPRST